MNSIAVAQRGASLLVAATKGKADSAQLVVGPLNGRARRDERAAPGR